MKKTVSVILSLVLLLSCATPVFAGEAATVTVVPETIEAGETVEITVVMPDSIPYLTSVAVEVEYDEAAFTVGRAPTGWIFGDVSGSTNVAKGNFSANDPILGDDLAGVTYKFAFTSKADAAAGEYEFDFKFDSGNTFDEFYNEIEIDGGVVTVTIEGNEPAPCEHANTVIRDDKPAQIGVPGYTGDTYCKDCGELIEEGEEIPALEDDTTGDNTTGDSTTGGSTTGGSTTGGSTTGGSTTGGSTTGGSTTGGSTTGGSTTGGSTTGGSTTGGSTTGGSTTGGSTTGGSTTGGSTTGGSTTGGSTTGGSTTGGSTTPTNPVNPVNPVGPTPDEPTGDTPTGIKYSDVSGHWCADLIYKWSQLGVIEGVGNGMFDPDGLLTRAQAATIFTRWLNLEATADISSFTDVKAGDWYYDYVAKCYAAGIVKGKSETQFAPNDYITRAEMFTMLCRALNIEGQTTISKVFSDADQIPAWAFEYTAALINNGYVSGMTATTLEPQGSLTRAQMVKLMDNLSGLVD